MLHSLERRQEKLEGKILAGYPRPSHPAVETPPQLLPRLPNGPVGCKRQDIKQRGSSPEIRLLSRFLHIQEILSASSLVLYY